MEMPKGKSMKITMAILGVVLFMVGCGHRQKATFQSLENPEVAVHLKSFVVGEGRASGRGDSGGRDGNACGLQKLFRGG
jgi:hypothetical protein